MLERLLIDRVRQRVETTGLPLAVQLWNGECLGSASAKVRIELKQLASLKALAHPELGTLARAYVEGALNLYGDIRDILAVGNDLCAADAATSRTGSTRWQWWRHTRSRDRRNIQYHYDVSNDFFGLWLDADRIYSCAYFRDAGMSLEAAQLAKLDHICRKLALKPGEKLLDIGCGWGGLVCHAAEHYGVSAVGVTLSEDQYAWASDGVGRRGLTNQVEIRLMDYRDIPEREGYDKIASVGMFEHVGRPQLAAYFEKIAALLKPGGLMLNHGITSAAPGTRGLGGGISEFVDEYVFPGGELVHASEVLHAAAASNLECLDAENLRPHYAATLWNWVARLEQHETEAIRLIGEDKYRIWRIYMAGSAHAFEQGWIELWQVLAGKGDTGRLSAYPFNREYQYR